MNLQPMLEIRRRPKPHGLDNCAAAVVEFLHYSCKRRREALICYDVRILEKMLPQNMKWRRT